MSYGRRRPLPLIPRNEQVTASQDQHVSTSASVFTSASGSSEISGGNFNAVAGNQIHFNFPSLSLQEHHRLGGHIHNVIVSTEIETENEPIERRPSESSYEIYRRHLMCKGRGTPLWFPQPDRNSPPQYRMTGTRLGDVVEITSDGSITYFFNIFCSANDPINNGDVPPSFVPLPVPKIRDIEALSAFGSGSHLSSSSIRKSYRNEDESGLTFESTASEGAILTMPLGSSSENLKIKSRIRKYVDQNIASWYIYLVNERGYELKNGDLRVVVGHDKAAAWGIAAFSSSQSETGGAPLYLSFRPLGEETTSQVYKWECSGSVEVKSGPDPRDMEDLRDREPAGTSCENQCLFVRTLNAKMQSKNWEALCLDFCPVNLVQEPGSPIGQPSDQSSMRHTTSDSCSPWLSSTASTIRDVSTSCTDTISSNWQMNDAASDTALRHSDILALDKVSHPADSLNDILLERYPDARIAITEDRVWAQAIQQGENDLLLGKELRLLLSSLEWCEEKGVAFVQTHKPKSRPAEFSLFGTNAYANLREAIPSAHELGEKIERMLRLGRSMFLLSPGVNHVAADLVNYMSPGAVSTPNLNLSQEYRPGRDALSWPRSRSYESLPVYSSYFGEGIIKDLEELSLDSFEEGEGSINDSINTGRTDVYLPLSWDAPLIASAKEVAQRSSSALSIEIPIAQIACEACVHAGRICKGYPRGHCDFCKSAKLKCSNTIKKGGHSASSKTGDAIFGSLKAAGRGERESPVSPRKKRRFKYPWEDA